MRRFGPRHHLVPLALAAGLVLGAPSAAAAATAVVDPQLGFSVSLPTNWHRVPLTGTDLTALLQAVSKQYPGLASVLNAQVTQAAKHGLKLFAVGPASHSFIPNFNVGVQPVPTTTPGPTFYAQAAAQLKVVLASSGATQLHVVPVVMPFGRAVEASYTFDLKSPTPHVVDGTQLYTVHAGRLYVITCSAGSRPQDRAIAALVERTWHWR